MIKIICLGKVKEKYLQDGIDEYIKRISKYTQVKIIELEDEGIKDDKVALKKEKEKILKYLNTTFLPFVFNKARRESKEDFVNSFKLPCKTSVNFP